MNHASFPEPWKPYIFLTHSERASTLCLKTDIEPVFEFAHIRLFLDNLASIISDWMILIIIVGNTIFFYQSRNASISLYSV